LLIIISYPDQGNSKLLLIKIVDADTTDPCQHALCQNGGQCMPDGHTYWCYCKAGYTGDLCDGKANVRCIFMNI
jgi:hypothetical protein